MALPQPATTRGEATRQKLLEAAEAEFGERGFAKASVSSITQRAGVGQGTFYLYFPSKESILCELVRHMGRELRRALSHATEGLTHRLQVEQQGLTAFIAFSLEHKNLYRIVMESQFVDETVYREYYQTLAQAYATGLEKAQRSRQIRSGDAETQAWALMGIAHFLGLRYAIWEGTEPAPEALQTVTDLLLHGLARGETDA